MSCVWIVNHYASDPDASATGSRHFSLSHQLHLLGWTPVIIAASSEHNSSNQRLEGRVRLGTTRRDGVTFRWLRSSGYVGNGMNRILNMVQFTVALLRPVSTSDLPKPQVIIGSTVHPLAAWAASRLASKHGVPFVFEIRDLWPQTLIDMGKLRQNGVPARMLRKLERHLVTRAARVITLMPRASDYLETVGVDADKIVWISNGTDTAEFIERPMVESDVFRFLYFGSLGYANGVPAIVRGFAQTVQAYPHRNLRLALVGGGAERFNLEQLCVDLNLGDLVEFHEPVPKAKIPEVAAQADSLVLNLLDLDIYRYGISLNKLFDYMAARRPIIIASNAVNNPVRDADGGVCVAANNPRAISDGMITVLNATPAQRALWGWNAGEFVTSHFDYGVLGGKLDSLLKEVLVVGACP